MEHSYRVGVAVTRAMARSIFAQEDLDFLTSFAEINPIDGLPKTLDPQAVAGLMEQADAIITCWGTPPISREMLEGAPRLRLVAHAAGSVRALVPPEFWNGKRRVCSNAGIIAEDVAQTTLALMLTSLRQLWGFAASTRAGEWTGGEASRFTTRRLDGLTVGVVGASMVGREVIKLIRPFGCRILLADPYVSPMEERALGVRRVELCDLLRESDVVSLHAPANEDCRHLINARTAPLIKDGALFINTARGLLVDEAALIKELTTGRIFACIDVTDPEPPAADHPFRKLPNVILTPHIAGGHTQNGRKMLGRNAILEVYNYLTRGLLANEVRPEMLKHMA